MASKFDRCMYSEYFGDYSMRLCNNPLQPKEKRTDCDCRKCTLFMTEKDNIDKCPFCGHTARANYYMGEHYIHCSNKECGCRTKGFKNIYDAIQVWNKRKIDLTSDAVESRLGRAEKRMKYELANELSHFSYLDPGLDAIVERLFKDADSIKSEYVSKKKK